MVAGGDGGGGGMAVDARHAVTEAKRAMQEIERHIFTRVWRC